MRKMIALLAAASLSVGLLAAPALAGKPKKVHDSFSAELLPFPKLAAWGDPVGLTKPGCTAGQEGVHWVAQEFAAPGNGKLKVYMEGFTGDHDLYIFDGDTAIFKSEGSQYDGSAPAEEEVTATLKKGQKISMVACNWLGAPEVTVHYDGTFK